jgi:hypothetical protein
MKKTFAVLLLVLTLIAAVTVPTVSRAECFGECGHEAGEAAFFRGVRLDHAADRAFANGHPIIGFSRLRRARRAFRRADRRAFRGACGIFGWRCD